MIKSLLAPETIYKQPTILRALQDEAGSDLNAESLLNDRITELLPPNRPSILPPSPPLPYPTIIRGGEGTFYIAPLPYPTLEFYGYGYGYGYG
jgi:hypothetical protein